MILKERGETFREAREREGRQEFEKHARAWLAVAPRDVLVDTTGRPLYCERCLAYVATTRTTHACPSDGGTQNTPFTARD